MVVHLYSYSLNSVHLYNQTAILLSDLEMVFATTRVSLINNPPTFIISVWLGVLIRYRYNYNVTSAFGNSRPSPPCHLAALQKLQKGPPRPVPSTLIPRHKSMWTTGRGQHGRVKFILLRFSTSYSENICA